MNRNGFTFIEALVSLNIIIFISLTVAPLLTLVMQERVNALLKRDVAYVLYEDLLYRANGNDGTMYYEKTLQQTNVQFTFQLENKHMRGCANWENKKKRKETFCLYSDYK